ncbi:thiamine ABC transporter permease [bacterium E08(2017)]|nr:thiamine ABC transporter permease [bacterium E08(2017)]
MVKRFAAFYGPHRKLFVIDMAAAVLQALAGVLIGVILNYALKDYLPNKDMSMLVASIVAVFILAALLGVSQYIGVRWGHILGARIETDMRSDLFSHLQKLSFSYFDNVKTGHIVSRISNDLFNVSEIAHHAPEDLFLTTFTIVPAFVAMFFFNLPLAIVTLVPLPLLFLWGMTYQGRMRNRYRHVRERIADINSSVENSIQGIREVKSFANEDLEIAHFEDVNTEFLSAKEKMYTVMAAFHSTMMFLMNCYPLVVITGGAVLVMREATTITDILTFSVFVRFIMNPIRRMVNFSEQFQQGAASFERFTEVLDIDPEIMDRPNAVLLDQVKGNIQFHDVSFSYGEDGPEVLKNIDLDIMAGKTVALVGESGAGKTTLAALIPRFYEPNSGNVSIDGHNVMDLKQTSLRDSIGIVRQNAFIFDASISENILIGRPDATREEVVEAARNANILEFIESLPDGFDTLAGEHGIKLSGGQRQRLSIARVFLKNPPILIFDEATSSLDTESESLIQKSMNDLCRDRTTLIIAHRLTTVKNADRIYVMKQGEIVESGTHDELIALQGYYHNLHQL